MQDTLHNRQNGYIGFVVLLVSVLILGIFFVRWMTVPNPKLQTDESFQPLTASGTVPTTRTEEYRADIDAAESIQKTITTHSVDLEEQL